MGADGVGRRRRARRALGRGARGVLGGFRAIWDLLELIDVLVFAVRVVTWPFRLLARALDALW